MKTGMQLYSLSPVIDAGKTEEAVRMACAAGIDGLELYGDYKTPALTYRKLLNEGGVVCCGTHNPLAPLRDDLDHVMEYNYVLGNRTIICHWLNPDERGSRENYLRVADSLNGIAAKLKRNGFDMLYHNHDFEFKEVFDGQTGYDLLAENLDPQLIGFELHIGQLPQFGLDIPAFIQKLGRRVRYLHVHAFNGDQPFDSLPGVMAAREFDTDWAILENVYPVDADPARVRADVEALRAMTRKSM